MAQWTRESVEELLQAKMKDTVARLKAKGHKAGLEDLASSLAPFIIAMMSDSRRRELGRLIKDDEMVWNHPNFVTQVKTRHKDLKVMAQVLWKFAEQQEERKKQR